MKWQFNGAPLTPIDGKPGYFKMFIVTVDIEGFGELDSNYDFALSLANTMFPKDGKNYGGFRLERMKLDGDD